MSGIEFYIIDGLLKLNDTTAPYKWTWSECSLCRKHTIKVIAYDNADNSDTDEMKVWKFF